ncbi:hypothetical protein L195_g024857 [Trifolium pratense]|uniref:RNase H type-1 domain-containing protein n=1 Tax=Trifolium pratense TaxID=57577 RepID=A0A2K3NEU6_TRIPR|nr:hypothetical protein L195_g024857 [Trifolium pratense]
MKLAVEYKGAARNNKVVAGREKVVALIGLRYVHRLGFRKVEVNIHPATVVQLVKNRQLHSSQGNALVKQIQKLVDKDWCVEILHTHIGKLLDAQMH